MRERPGLFNLINMKKNKRGQVAIYIIFAIILIAAIILFFVFRGTTGGEVTTVKFEAIEASFIDCIKDTAAAGASILGERGGYIYAPDFEPGSMYSPSSNQLDFLGTGIPFWLYFQGNDIAREQMPTKQDMQRQLERYIDENLECDFEEFIKQGYFINTTKTISKVEIWDNEIKITVQNSLVYEFGANKEVVKNHKASIKTRLGKFYNIAYRIYNKEKSESFIEDYAIDAMHLYAPVNGVELSCAPKVWKIDEIRENLKKSIEANTLMMRGKGGYYTVDKENEYFVIDVGSDVPVRFAYSSSWPTKIEVDGGENGILVAQPVGANEGIGILGFCYVPYHFVYDISYPVLIQLYDDKEIFQFPVVISIEKNQKRKALEGGIGEEINSELCKYKNSRGVVKVFNSKSEPIEADISFKCFNEVCPIGKSAPDGSISENFPRCVNGFVMANAEGYHEGKAMMSTNEDNSYGEIFLKKIYQIPLELNLIGGSSNAMAIIYFNSDDYDTVVSWPDQKEVSLIEGQYNVSAYVYANSSILIQGTTTKKCVDIPKPGLRGLLGQKKEECFQIAIPSQEIANVIIGGGKGSSYIPESELERGSTIVVETENLPIPKTITQLQDNYNRIYTNTVYVDFK